MGRQKEGGSPRKRKGAKEKEIRGEGRPRGTTGRGPDDKSVREKEREANRRRRKEGGTGRVSDSKPCYIGK